MVAFQITVTVETLIGPTVYYTSEYFFRLTEYIMRY